MTENHEDLLRTILANQPNYSKQIAKLTELIISQSKMLSHIQRDLYGIHQGDCSTADHIARNMNLIFNHQRASEALARYIGSIPHSPQVGLYSYQSLKQYNHTLTDSTISSFCPSLKCFQIYLGEKFTGRIEESFESRIPMRGTDRILFSEAYNIPRRQYFPIRNEAFTATISVKSSFLHASKVMQYDVQISALGDIYFSQTFRIPKYKIGALEYYLSSCRGNDGYVLNARASGDQIFDVVTPNQVQVYSEMCVIYHEVDLRFAEKVSAQSAEMRRVIVADTISVSDLGGIAFDPSHRVMNPDGTTSSDDEGLKWLVNYSMVEENSNINLKNVSDTFGMRFCSQLETAVRQRILASLFTMSVDSLLDFSPSGGEVDLDSQSFLPESGSINLLSEAIVANTRSITQILSSAIMYSEVDEDMKDLPFVSRAIPCLLPRKVNFHDSWLPGPTSTNSFNAWLYLKDVGTTPNFRSKSDKPTFIMNCDIINECYIRRPSMVLRVHEDSDMIVEMHYVIKYLDSSPSPSITKATIMPSAIVHRDPGLAMDVESLRVWGNTYAPSQGGRHELFSVASSTPNLQITVSEDQGICVEEIKCFVLFKNALNKIGLVEEKENLVSCESYGAGICGTSFFKAWNSTEYTTSDGRQYYGIFAIDEKLEANNIYGDFLLRLGPWKYHDKGLVGESSILRTSSWYRRDGEFEFDYGGMPTYDGVKGKIKVTLTTADGETGWNEWPYTGEYSFNLTSNLSDPTATSMFYSAPDVEKRYSKVSGEVKRLAQKVSKAVVFSNESGSRCPWLDTITARVLSLRLSLKVPITKATSGDLISCDQRFNDVEATIAGTRAIAEEALSISERNEQRINEIDSALKAMEDQANFEAGIQMFAFAAELSMPVMGKVLTIMAEQTAKLSSVSARVIGKGLKGSSVATPLINLNARSKGVEKAFNSIGKASVETRVMFKSIKKAPPKIDRPGIDLFQTDKNFVLYDPLEFQKFNVFTAQKKSILGDGIIEGAGSNHKVAMKSDVTSSVLTVYHRPLQFLPKKISTAVHDLSVHGLSSVDLTARERWLRKTLHPTHSYVTISYDYPVVKTNKTRHVITYTGIGDSNPGGLRTGDKAAGVGTYSLEYDIIGLSKADGYRMMELRSHVDCGYTDEQCRNIYSTMFQRDVPSHMSLQEAWEEIGAHSRRRTVVDTEVASTPVSLDREWRLRSMLEQKDWEYNLLFKNCQDYAHGLYYYAQGGPVPKWISEKAQIQSYLDVSHRLDELSTWEATRDVVQYVDHGPLVSF
ncbi:structural protein P1 [Raspberry latent virus]|uniref:structural protein P1 n=1 Tax=Raspberry latent virus TaxID=907191 RepID=UPI0001E69017|nr:structural protein P1 [Raspberry latent virus]ADO27686.1 structural protein P1 [Raspberry latent virus]